MEADRHALAHADYYAYPYPDADRERDSIRDARSRQQSLRATRTLQPAVRLSTPAPPGPAALLSLMLTAAACFDPKEAIPLWERMAQASGGQTQPEFASSHPNPGTRIEHLQALMPKAMEYRQKFCDQAGSGATGAIVN